MPQNEGVRLFYTGNVKVNGERYTSQNQVHLSDPDGPHGGIFRPDPANPLIDGPAPGFTAHFRDPHVTCDEQGWRMVIGAQNDALEGQVVLYRSQDLDSWEFQGPLNFDRPAPRGYMYECPNLLTMTDTQTGEQRDVLVICPQSDVDTCVYAVGLLDGTSFHIETDFAPLDFGHEFYAPHLVSRDGRALMMAWMGLPGRDETPTEGWVHCLTAVRELVLENGRIKQEILLPEQALQTRVDLADEERVLTVFDSHGNPGPRVHYEPEKGTLTLSREGDIRSMACGSGELHLTVDGCALELTAEDGLVAAASMAYGDWTEITEERL
ncbi:sucrose-6-phosphate hydrolase [Corynebacterium tapiri]